MNHATPLSRREFAALAAAAPLAFAARPAGAAAVSALEVIARIRKSIGVEWKPDTVDAIAAGDPATTVTGIVTTSLATMAVLEQATRAGANLVVTSGPTSYARRDPRAPTPTQPPRPDRVVEARDALIARNRLVIFRLRDHWRLRRPDPLAQGLGDALGWAKYRAAEDASRYQIPATTLAALVTQTKKKLAARGGIRVIGDPRTRARTIALLPGSTPLAASLAALPRADVVIAGEVREWESVEYARDVVDSGQLKGLILVGRLLSEEPGMQVCASWLKTLVPEVSVRHVAAGDPYWRPE
jgi:putative NIF3 family GTP cyclohydrolase 1 type 2